MTPFSPGFTWTFCAQSISGAVATGLALSPLVIAPAQAAPQVYDITIDVTAGSLAGNQFSGSICYDDEFLTGIGSETVTPYLGLTTRMTFLGQTYDETADTDYPEFPQLSLKDGEIDRLEFWVESDQRGSWWETPGWAIALTRQAPETLTGCGPTVDGITVQ